MAKLNGEKDALGALAIDKARSTKLTPGPASVEYRDAAALVKDSNPPTSAKTPLPSRGNLTTEYRDKAEKQVASRINKLQKQ